MLKKFAAIVGSAALVASLASSSAFGQEGQRVRLAGSIERLDGEMLIVRSGQSERRVQIAPNARLLAVVKATLADVQPGAFIGVGAMPEADGSQRAIRVMIFAESMRGLGEGHGPWNRPGSTMTNATVDTTVSSVAGNIVAVKYKGGEKKIIIGSEAEILACAREVDLPAEAGNGQTRHPPRDAIVAWQGGAVRGAGVTCGARGTRRTVRRVERSRLVNPGPICNSS